MPFFSIQSPASGNALQLQGRSISSTGPTGGQVLTWDGSSWSPLPGVTGPTGVSGLDGSRIYSGATGPFSGLGASGDFYIDTTAGVLYGPKASGSWGSGLQLATGQQGPTGATGVAGAAGATGATGATGAAGAAGAAGATGPTGSAGAMGATGPAGSAGTAGAAGATGPTGAASTAIGPTGATGPAGTGATGPTGPAGSGGSGEDTLLRSIFVPPAPTSVSATAGSAQATVTWTAPTVLSITPVTDYIVQYSSNGGSAWTTFSDGTSTAASATVTGLANGTAYVFRVAAVNGVGTGAFSSASSGVTPGGDSLASSLRGLLHFDNNATDTSGTGTWTGSASYSTTSRFGSHSLYPNGSYLQRSYNAANNFGTGDFTIEAWVYPLTAASSGSYGIYATSGGPDSTPKFVVHLENLQPKVHLGTLSGLTNAWLNSNVTLTANQWSHIAIVRSSGSWAWYVNGTRTATGSESANITFTSQPSYIGYGGEAYFDSFAGYIDELRLTAAARYSGTTITVPTTAFPDP